MPWLPPEREKIAVLMPTSAAADVDEGAAGIARIDGGVGLDEELVVGDADLGARERRDDAVRHGLADAEGVADGEHEIADLRALRNRRTRARAAAAAPFSLEHGEVGARIAQHDLASNSRRSASATFTSVMFSMTWWLVTTSPVGSTITPEPSERWRDDAVRAAGRRGRPSPKKRRKNSSIAAFCWRALDAGAIDVDDRRSGPLHDRREGELHLARLSGTARVWAGASQGSRRGRTKARTRGMRVG